MKKRGFSPVSMAVLKYGLAAVSLVFLYIAVWAASLDVYDAARLYSLLAEQMEHAMMSLLLTVAGAVVLDIALIKR